MQLWEKEYPLQTQELVRYAHLVYDRKLVSAAGGNLSVRCGDYILITASNISMRDVSAENLLLCDARSRVVEGNQTLLPSKETPFHLHVYAARPNVGAIIHAHPVYATAFSLQSCLPLLTDSARLKLQQVPIIPEAKPGSKQLAYQVAESVATHLGSNAFLMEAHGILACGADMKSCFDTAELLEDTAHIACLNSLLLAAKQ